MNRTRAENAAFVIENIRALGLKLNASSRLMRQCKLLSRPSPISPSDPQFELALEAERDMQLLGFVFDQPHLDKSSPTFKALVRRTLGDPALPQESGGETPGRDAQFELFVGALCHSAGLLPVSYEEPDVVCTLEGQRWAIAAKRVKSLASLEQRVKEAAKQIRRAGLPGVIAIDTCVPLNPDNQRIIEPISDERFGELYSRAFRHFMDEHASRINGWVEGKGVLGVVFHDQQVRMAADREWELSGLTTSLATFSEDGLANSDFSAFWLRYKLGLPNLQ